MFPKYAIKEKHHKKIFIVFLQCSNLDIDKGKSERVVKRGIVS